ncbi:MAG: T9SS type A sorting domain-containing protein [Bacteroidetes bacterium]|nr:T9SS type A sorting domain-containing protein [Bacteroidota bacterium]
MKRGNKIFFLLLLVTSIVTYKYIPTLKTNFEKNDQNIEREGNEKKTDIERGEYFFRMLRDPATNQIPQNIRRSELAFASRLPKAENVLFKTGSALSISWKEAGPNDVGGRTRAIGVDVNNSNIVLAGGATGGMWKSTDNGASWKLTTSISDVQGVTSIAQDTRPGFTNTWYYSGGEYDGSGSDQGYAAYFFGGGVYKSTDNGDSWTLLPATQTSSTSWNSVFSFTSRIIVNPTTGSVFVASNAGVIMKSTNGGTSFSLVLGRSGDHNYTDVVVNSNGTLVATLSSTPGNTTPQLAPGVYKSTDDGLTWVSITPNTFPTDHQRSVIAFSPSQPNIAYVFTNTGQKVSGKEDLRLHKIDISNNSAQDLSANLPDLNLANSKVDTQRGYDMALAVHPTNPNIVLIAGTSLFRSFDAFTTQPTDARTNWIGGYHPISFFYPNIHPDIHTIIFDPNDPNKVWVGNDGGLSYTTDITTTSYQTYFPWQKKNNGYNVTQYYNMALSSGSGDSRLMGGTQDNGTPFFTFDGTTTSASTDVTTGDGAYAYLGNSFAYGETQNGDVVRLPYNNGVPLFQSSVGIKPSGASGMLFINPFKVDPSDENYMYYLGGTLLWRNNKLGQADTSIGWSSIDISLPQGYFFSTLAVTSTNPSHVLYLGASSQTDAPKIYKITNSTTSTTAQDISPALPEVSNGAYVHNIAVNPDNGNEILVVHSNYNIVGLFYSNNGGQTYTAVEGNLQGTGGPSIRSATILPTAQGTIYVVGTSIGVYSTTQLNGMNTVWKQEGTNELGNVIVEYVTSRTSDGTIVAATHGRGAFVGKVSGGTDVADNSVMPTQYSLDQNYPNPFNPSTKISYSLPASSKVSLKIYDSNGREVESLVNGVQAEGKHEINFNAAELASGVYFYRIIANNPSNSSGQSFMQTKKMILLK